MYPQVLLLGIAVLTRDKGVKKYILPLSAIGAVIAGYHYSIATISKASSYQCSVGASCLVDFFTEFGYVTIPLMALTAFVLIFTLVYLWKKDS